MLPCGRPGQLLWRPLNVYIYHQTSILHSLFFKIIYHLIKHCGLWSRLFYIVLACSSTVWYFHDLWLNYFPSWSQNVVCGQENSGEAIISKVAWPPLRRRPRPANCPKFDYLVLCATGILLSASWPLIKTLVNVNLRQKHINSHVQCNPPDN